MSSCATTNITTDVEEKRGDDDAGDAAADRGSVNTKDGTPAADDPPAADGTTTVDSIITTTAPSTTTTTTTTTASIACKFTKNAKAGAGIGGGIVNAKDDTTPVKENLPTDNGTGSIPSVGFDIVSLVDSKFKELGTLDPYKISILIGFVLKRGLVENEREIVNRRINQLEMGESF